jgi:hypothetical protein
MNRSQEHSFKARMRRTSHELGVAAQELWEILVLERFLVRLARSTHSKMFVLKGGLLLSRYVEIGRHTQDLDFLLKGMGNDHAVLSRALNDILAVQIDDGFNFFDLVLTPLPHPHMKYAGTRASMRAHFGKTRFKVLIDIGCGDLIEPIRQSLPLLTNSQGPLFENHVEISCYPPEFIFAEKLETIVYLEGRNSRMKDFHDVFLMTRANQLMGADLERIARSVFAHRQTPLRIPLLFTPNELSALQSFWTRHLGSGFAKGTHLPSRLEDVIDEINSWLARHTNLC